MVLPEKKDIVIPQGIAHSVDRVMFPLPVGDILQTLQSDRERRFTNFLRALFSSGLSELLQNKGNYNEVMLNCGIMLPLIHTIPKHSKSDRNCNFSSYSMLSIDPQSGRTYTVFAPTDAAFANQTQEEVNFMVTDKASAHKCKRLCSDELFE